jgi:hypothetical protein
MVQSTRQTERPTTSGSGAVVFWRRATRRPTRLRQGVRRTADGACGGPGRHFDRSRNVNGIMMASDAGRLSVT